MFFFLLACNTAPEASAPLVAPARPAAPAAVAPAAAAARLTLCNTGETIRFSCSTAQGKVISLCASADLSASKGGLQYHFGKPGALELSYPAAPSRSDFTFLKQTHINSESYSVIFSQSGFTYTVFDQNTMGSATDHGAGVTVEKDKKIVATILCAEGGKETLDILGLQGIIPDAPH